MAKKKLVQCPACKFTNRFGDQRCLICKELLPQTEAERYVPAGLERDDLRRTVKTTREELLKQAEEAMAAPKRPSSRLAAPVDEDAEIVAWLCCDPLPPIPLGSKPKLTLGRSDKCDLVLPHKEVSRVHGLIKVRGSGKKGMVVYEDEGSSNGSYLNGKRVSSTILKEGDSLTVGPYELEVVSDESMQERLTADGSDTNTLDLTSVARVNPLAAMAGVLDEVPISELLQGIEFNKKTGTLTIFAKDEQAELTYEDGRPMTARFGEKRDEEAVLAMLALEQGRFTIAQGSNDSAPRIKVGLTALLFEYSRLQDEGDGSEEGVGEETSDHPADEEVPEDALASGFETLEDEGG